MIEGAERQDSKATIEDCGKRDSKGRGCVSTCVVVTSTVATNYSHVRYSFIIQYLDVTLTFDAESIDQR